MPRQKRASEKELNKDIYDAEEDDRFAETPDPGRGMSRASQEVIKQRKIIKVRRKFGAGSGSGSSGAPVSQPAASSNPFASTTLAQPTTMPTSQAPKKAIGDESSSKPNPFATIALASNSNSATKAEALKPIFSFTSTSSASAPKPSTSTGFSFASKNSSSSTTTSLPNATSAPQKSLLSTPKSPRSKKARIRELNENFLHMIVDHWEGGMFAADYTHFMKEYQAHEERLQTSDDDEVNGGTKNNSQPASSWSAPAPSPSAKPFALGARAPAAPKTTTFSFSTKPAGAPAAGAPSAPSFSFGAPSSSSLAGSAAPSTAAGSSNNDDTASNPDDGKVEKIEQEENTDEDVLLEVRAKHVKREEGQWKKYGAGVLRLYRHRVNSKCRMVIRNDIGKVQFNVGVSKGMKFEKVIKQSKKGPAAYVKFLAVEDASKGLESFMLQVKPDSLDKLHETLEGMVA